MGHRKTQERNEHQPVPSGLVIYPCYQQCQQFHPNVYTSHDESPSGSGSGSGSGNVNKRCEATEVKILISAYKDHQENINNSKSSKGKKSVWEKIFDTFTEHCQTAGFGASIKPGTWNIPEHSGTCRNNPKHSGT